MAHKAKRRPSWKKNRRKSNKKFFDFFLRKISIGLAREIQQEIDKEILDELLKINGGMSKTVMCGTANP